MINMKYLIWALLAGAFIPLIGILNGRVGRALGEPFYAAVMLFGVAIMLALAVSVIFTFICIYFFNKYANNLRERIQQPSIQEYKPSDNRANHSKAHWRYGQDLNWNTQSYRSKHSFTHT